MAAHKVPASLRPRCIRGGSSVAATPVYQSTSLPVYQSTSLPRINGNCEVECRVVVTKENLQGCDAYAGSKTRTLQGQYCFSLQCSLVILQNRILSQLWTAQRQKFRSALRSSLF
jgi:hypothetical protein